MFYTLGLSITKNTSLKLTLESIVAQTFLDFEVIIQNNAIDSQERMDIRDSIKKYLQDIRFKYFENESSITVCDNLNSLLYKAVGDYFCLISEADILDRKYLEIFNALILKYNHCDIFHCRVKIVGSKGKVIEVSPLCPEYESQADFIYHIFWQKRIQFMADFIVSTDRLKKIRGFEKFQLMQQLEELTWYRLSENGIAYTSFPALVYKSNSLNVCSSIDHIERRFREIDYFISETKEILFDKNFDNPLYVTGQFESKIDSREHLLYRNVFEVNLSLLSYPKMILFFLKYRKKYNFKNEFIYYALKAKITNNRSIDEYKIG